MLQIYSLSTCVDLQTNLGCFKSIINWPFKITTTDSTVGGKEAELGGPGGARLLQPGFSSESALSTSGPTCTTFPQCSA